MHYDVMSPITVICLPSDFLRQSYLKLHCEKLTPFKVPIQPFLLSRQMKIGIIIKGTHTKNSQYQSIKDVVKFQFSLITDQRSFIQNLKKKLDQNYVVLSNTHVNYR